MPNYSIDRLLRLLTRMEKEDPDSLDSLENEFSPELSLLESGQDSQIPDGQVEAMINWIETNSKIKHDSALRANNEPVPKRPIAQSYSSAVSRLFRSAE